MQGDEVGDCSEVVRAVIAYLRQTGETFAVGQEEYYAGLALQQALFAHLEGNYGIGAVAVVVSDREVAEYPARNAMLTGDGVVDHAEIRAILAVRTGQPPSRLYPRKATEYTAGMQPGITVFGTVEPCPMCACAMTNAGVVRSVSTVQDGDLVTADGVISSDGGSTVLGKKWYFQPRYWRAMQERTRIRFEVGPANAELMRLSREVFSSTAEERTERLTSRRSAERGRERGGQQSPALGRQLRQA